MGARPKTANNGNAIFIISLLKSGTPPPHPGPHDARPRTRPRSSGSVVAAFAANAQQAREPEIDSAAEVHCRAGGPAGKFEMPGPTVETLAPKEARPPPSAA